MRTSKRWLAGVAAGALGAGMLSMVAATPAQAATPATVEFAYPSVTVVGSNLKADDTMIGVPVTVYDASGDEVSTADMTGYKVEVTIAKPSTVPGGTGDDSVVLSVQDASATQGLSIDTADLEDLSLVTVRPRTGAFAGVVGSSALTWDSVVTDLGYTGTYTLSARLYATANGAVISTATMPFNAVTSAAPGVAQMAYVNTAGNVLNQIGGTASAPVGSYAGGAASDDSFYVLPLNSAGGPVFIDDDSLALSFTSSTTAGTWSNGRTSGFGEGLGTGVVTIGDDDVNWTNVLGSTVTATYTPAASSAVTAGLPVRIGGATEVDPAPTVLLTNATKYDTTPTSSSNKTYQVPPGTTTLTFSANTAEAYDDTTIAYNATATATGGSVTASGGAATVVADAGSVTLTLNAAAAAVDETVVLYSGSYATGGKLQTTTVAFRNPTATLATTAGIAQVSTASPITGTVTDQYGAVLPGTWAISLKNDSGSCSATSIATATADASGAFSIEIPVAYARTSAGSKTFGVCASNGFSSVSGTQAVTYTTSGGVTSLTAQALVVGDAATVNVPVVRTPPAGVANLTTLTTTTVSPTQTALTSANINTANTGTAFKVQATVNPQTAITFSGTEGVLFSTATTGSVLYSNGTATATVTSSSATPSLATVSVFATKPGKHTVTVTAGTSTATVQFWAGVAAGSGRFLAAEPTEIVLAPSEFKAAAAKITDIYGNAVPDDTSVVVALAGGGTTSPAQPITAGTLTSSAAGVVTVFYTAPLGSGTGLLSWSSANFQTGTIPGVATAVTTATTTIKVTSTPTEKTIVITGTRGTVKGKPGIIVEGATTGFDVGSKMVPNIRFPGQSSYEAGSARPETSVVGDFTWQRKTGKKIYVFFTNEAGDVKSNRVIIQAK